VTSVATARLLGEILITQLDRKQPLTHQRSDGARNSLGGRRRHRCSRRQGPPSLSVGPNRSCPGLIADHWTAEGAHNRSAMVPKSSPSLGIRGSGRGLAPFSSLKYGGNAPEWVVPRHDRALDFQAQGLGEKARYGAWTIPGGSKATKKHVQTARQVECIWLVQRLTRVMVK